MGDWADGKAREWLEAASPAVVMEIRERWMAVNLPSLAALLRVSDAVSDTVSDTGRQAAA